MVCNRVRVRELSSFASPWRSYIFFAAEVFLFTIGSPGSQSRALHSAYMTVRLRFPFSIERSWRLVEPVRKRTYHLTGCSTRTHLTAKIQKLNSLGASYLGHASLATTGRYLHARPSIWASMGKSPHGVAQNRAVCSVIGLMTHHTVSVQECFCSMKYRNKWTLWPADQSFGFGCRLVNDNCAVRARVVFYQL
jgi:hypothetical protein